MTFFVRCRPQWPAEETFKTGRGTVLGWDQSQASAWDAVSPATAWPPSAQLRQAAVRNHLCGDITLPGPPAGASQDNGRDGEDDGVA